MWRNACGYCVCTSNAWISVRRGHHVADDGIREGKHTMDELLLRIIEDALVRAFPHQIFDLLFRHRGFSGCPSTTCEEQEEM